MKKLIPLLFLIAAVSANALEGRVVAVLDGDTIDVLDANNRSHRIRFAEIDAPELKGQAFGQMAKQKLSDLCYGRHASVVEGDHDRYGRTVGVVTCNGINANQAMVSSGLAWVYRQYTHSPALFRAEEEARASRRGLWADPSPTPPWLWRRQNK